MNKQVANPQSLNFGKYSCEFLEAWKKQGYQDIALSYPQEKLEKILCLFNQILESTSLELRLKMRKEISLPNNPKKNEIGFYRKVKKLCDVNDENCRLSVDNKEFIHYHPAFEGIYEKFRDPMSKNQQELFEEFILEANKAWNSIVYDTIEPQIKELNKTIPGIYDRIFNSRGIMYKGKSYPIILSRYMRYEPDEDVVIIGEGHFDRGALTLRVAENINGFLCGHDSWDLNTCTRVDNKQGFGNFFPGNAFIDLLSLDFPYRERLRSGHGAKDIGEGEITLQEINPKFRFINAYFIWPTEMTPKYKYRATARDEL